ncbi:hypothetical protein Taro_036552 [Colocasia esculenta]|uniref:Uncharacterized protein n=1 Tax=Colocasia esculenta TaxID=4460 RepID=A0A843W3D4_COLES|nr:hypothetical protein [Colocasia esculenta]
MSFKLQPMEGGDIGFLLGQWGAKVAHIPVGNGYMRCMAERMALVGWNLGQLRRPASRGIAANMQSAAVDAAVYMGSKASQQMVKQALLGHGTMRGWAKSRVYKYPSETSGLAGEQSGLKGWCLSKQRMRRFNVRAISEDRSSSKPNK